PMTERDEHLLATTDGDPVSVLTDIRIDELFESPLAEDRPDDDHIRTVSIASLFPDMETPVAPHPRLRRPTHQLLESDESTAPGAHDSPTTVIGDLFADDTPPATAAFGSHAPTQPVAAGAAPTPVTASRAAGSMPLRMPRNWRRIGL